MTEQESTAFCAHCQSKLIGNFCSNCGTPQIVKRIDGTFILSEILGMFNLDKGIFYTIRALVTRPGKNIRDFILKDRKRLVKPIFFVVICSLMYTAAQEFLRFEDEYVTGGGFGDSAITAILGWVQKNYGYSNILMAVFIALWIKVFFRKYNYNFFEILTLLSYVTGICMLIYAIFGATESLSKLKVLHLGSLLGLVYVSWSVGQFFDGSKKINFFKAFLAYFLGMMSFTFFALLVGVTIDLIRKM